jgi:hypothetical protein
MLLNAFFAPENATVYHSQLFSTGGTDGVFFSPETQSSAY